MTLKEKLEQKFKVLAESLSSDGIQEFPIHFAIITKFGLLWSGELRPNETRILTDRGERSGYYFPMHILMVDATGFSTTACVDIETDGDTIDLEIVHGSQSCEVAA